ncbi:MAG: AraC family transcriptional regulator [Herbaspirillum sp.]|jgi:AraC-like DNA-binding protein|nr:AraC family transcriptional regulator [Herbaspirillum sp.]
MTSHIQATAFNDQSSGKMPDYGMAATRSDVLSQVLTLIRLRGELVYSARLRAPWSITFPKGAAHFYFVESGTLWVKTLGAEPIAVNQGDMLLLPHGTGHLICDNPATPSEEIGSLIGEHFDREKSVLDYGGEGVPIHVVGGLFHFEGGSLAAIMAALPLVVHIPSEQGKTPDWLHALTHFLVKESHEVEPGSSLMISRLIDLLVIRTLRTWAASQAHPSSWIGALGDERIGRALNAIHAAPYHPWTVEGLAGLAAMSRSIFSERFTARVGEAPLHYVKRLKLTLAADMLASGGLRVTQAAERIGYGSDAAFSRAFKAQFGYAPSEASQRQDGSWGDR